MENITKWLIAPIKIFDLKSKKLLLNIETGKVFEIDDITESIVKKDEITEKEFYNIASVKYSKEEIDELVLSMQNEKVLLDKKVEKEKTILTENSNISCVVLMVIQDCNLRCTYCYGDGGRYNNEGQMSLETALKSIDYLIENNKIVQSQYLNNENGENPPKRLSVIFFGGEPLMRYDLIQNVVKYCKEKEKEYNIIFDYSMTTNGTLITKEISKFIVDNKFNVTLSIDGTKENHDLHRKYEDKTGSYDDVIKNSAYLRDNYKIAARGTITCENMDIMKNYKHLKNIGFKSVYLTPAYSDIDETGCNALKKQYSSLINYLNQLIEEGDIEGFLNYNYAIDFISKLDVVRPKYKSCGALNNMIAVDKDGKLYPCHRCVSSEELCVGSIYERDEKKEVDILKDMLLDSSEECSQCWAKVFCGGGCIYENFSSNKTLTKPTKNYCDAMKHLLEELTCLYFGLSDEKRNEIKEYSKNYA